MQEIGYRARFAAHLRPRLGGARVDVDDLRALDETLTAVVGAILQESNRTAGTIIGVATSKLVAAGVMAGTFGGIAAFGAAGTGTAIATLSGAAWRRQANAGNPAADILRRQAYTRVPAQATRSLPALRLDHLH